MARSAPASPGKGRCRTNVRRRGLLVNRAINPSAALSESQRSYLYMVVYEQTPPVSLTLNHLPLPGEARALRACGRLRAAPTGAGEPRRLRRSGSPSWRPLQGASKTIGLRQPTENTPSASRSLSSSPRGGAKGALRRVIIRHSRPPGSVTARFSGAAESCK